MSSHDHERNTAEQIDAAECFADCNPSEVTEVYWLYAKNESTEYPQATPNSGKWLVFVDAKEIDRVWSTIAAATRKGLLGGRSKVATAAPNRFSEDSTRRVICVYTYDWTDTEDVRRIREELRRLGITRKIAYKSDEDTIKGIYRVTGQSRIAKYYE